MITFSVMMDREQNKYNNENKSFHMRVTIFIFDNHSYVIEFIFNLNLKLILITNTCAWYFPSNN